MKLATWIERCLHHQERLDALEAGAPLKAIMLTVRESSSSLPEALQSMPEVANILSAKQIEALSLPENYVWVGPEMLDNLLALARKKDKRKS